MKQHLLLVLMLLVTAGFAQTTPNVCKGKTKGEGKPCRSVIVSKETGYCNAHNPNRVKCSGKTTSGKPCQMVCLKNQAVCRFHKGA